MDLLEPTEESKVPGVGTSVEVSVGKECFIVISLQGS